MSNTNNNIIIPHTTMYFAFDNSDFYDIAKLMHLAEMQCQWKLDSLTRRGDTDSKEWHTVDNALAAAQHYQKVFKGLHEAAVKADEPTSDDSAAE